MHILEYSDFDPQFHKIICVFLPLIFKGFFIFLTQALLKIGSIFLGAKHP